MCGSAAPEGDQYRREQTRNRAVSDQADNASAEFANTVLKPDRPLAARIAASKRGSRRSIASMSASVSSATARALVPGRLHTGMPRAFAASRSIVFTPTPIFWISLSFGAAAIISAVQRFSTCQITSVSAAGGQASPRRALGRR